MQAPNSPGTDEMKEADNECQYSEFEDIKDRGVVINDTSNNATKTTTITNIDTTSVYNEAYLSTRTRGQSPSPSASPSASASASPSYSKDKRSMYTVRPVRLHSSSAGSGSSGSGLYASQPCVYWLSGCCRFGSECHYLHQSPPLTPPAYTLTPSSSLSSPTAVLLTPAQIPSLSSLPSPVTVAIIPSPVSYKDKVIDSMKTIDTKASDATDDLNKRKRRGSKAKSKPTIATTATTATDSSKGPDVEHTAPTISSPVVSPTISPIINTNKRGKKKSVTINTIKTATATTTTDDSSNSGVTSPSVESKEGADDIATLTRELEKQMAIKSYAQKATATNDFIDIDHSSFELMLLDLFQHSPKHFLLLVKLGATSYISEEVADNIISSRNDDGQSLLTSLQDIINLFKFRIKKKDLIIMNRDIIMAYCKQRQDVQAQRSLALHEQHEQHEHEAQSQGSKGDDIDSRHDDDRYRNQKKRSERKAASYANQDQSLSSISPPSQNDGSHGQSDAYPDSNVDTNDSSSSSAHISPTDNNTCDGTTNQINTENNQALMQGGATSTDDNYYYTYIDPSNGFQYMTQYPIQQYGQYGYPPGGGAYGNPAEYMNQYPYGYYPSMDYYPPHPGTYNNYPPSSSMPPSSMSSPLIRSTQATPSAAPASSKSSSSSETFMPPQLPSSSAQDYAGGTSGGGGPSGGTSDGGGGTSDGGGGTSGGGGTNGAYGYSSPDYNLAGGYDQPNYYAPYDYNAQYNTGYYPTQDQGNYRGGGYNRRYSSYEGRRGHTSDARDPVYAPTSGHSHSPTPTPTATSSFGGQRGKGYASSAPRSGGPNRRRNDHLQFGQGDVRQSATSSQQPNSSSSSSTSTSS